MSTARPCNNGWVAQSEFAYCSSSSSVILGQWIDCENEHVHITLVIKSVVAIIVLDISCVYTMVLFLAAVAYTAIVLELTVIANCQVEQY